MVGVSLTYLAGLGMFVCWIIVLIQMFKDGVVNGILGLICGVYAYVWGWMHLAGGLRNVMIIWTILLLVSIVLGFSFDVTNLPTY